jgi:hypothetical protein
MITGRFGTILRTTDGGITWTLQISQTQWSLLAVSYINANNCIAVGENGTILRSSEGGVTFIKGANLNLPNELTLYQNYPNPFNPSTVIQFALPEASDVIIELFNLLGQKVDTIVGGNFVAGVHKIRYDASHLAGGVYFYKIRAGKFTETHKMLLIR